MKSITFLILIFSLLSCNEQPPVEESNPSTSSEISENVSEEQIKQEVLALLNIEESEKISIDVYFEHLNTDEHMDAIIRVNRLEKAKNEAIKSGKIAKKAETGFMGLYNYIVYWDGAGKKCISSVNIPSSAIAPLTISFENITSNIFKDIIVEYRIRNSCFRNFYTLRNNIPSQTLVVKMWDGLGTENVEGYVVKYAKGTYSAAKDINVYKGIITNMTFDNPKDVYSAFPRITATDELERNWFYNDSQFKYYTSKN